MSDECAECPLCMEALEIDDHSFFPCTCGYQICRFCWHRIRTDENGLCPACRKQYPEDPAEFKPLTDDELQNIKKERKQKDVQRKQKAAENRKHLANVRVVQRNLVFVVGLSPRLADPEVLKKHEYFGKFGKIHKVVINQSTSYAGSQGPSASAYVTYVKPEDALRAILTVNNVHVEGRTLKTSLGTTKYCSHFLKGSHCQKNDCMYLHELGEEAASFTKDEMQAGKHQEYEQMLTEQFLNAQNSANSHHIANNKLKKSVSPQSIESTDVIPSLMDMTGDIKHSGPLLPNPVVQTNGVGSNGHSSGWPVLDGTGSPAPGGGGKNEHSSLSTENNRTQQGYNPKTQSRTNTPPSSSGSSSNSSRVVGNGRQRGSNASSEENLISNQVNAIGSDRSLSTSPPGDVASESGCDSPQLDASSNNRGLPLPLPVPVMNGRGGSSGHSSQGSVSPRNGNPSPAGNSVPIPTNVDIPQMQNLQHQDPVNGIVGAIGSNRTGSTEAISASQGLSFFVNNLLSSTSTSSATPPATVPVSNSRPETPEVPFINQEIDAFPVSSTVTTDWSAAFGFKNKEVPPDDDLGFDPCAESFKGLADLIEKENGMQNQHQHQHLSNSMQAPSSQSLSPGRLGSPQQTGFPPHPGLQASPPHPNQHPANTQPLQQPPLVRSLPPGFSISHIQQQQQLQQQFFRPEVANSKMLELLPQFAHTTQQRFPPLHSYHSLSLDMHTQQQQHHQHTQNNDLYNMKDMQEQLRSMLPNINISFGSFPHQQQQQNQQVPTSMHTTAQSQHLNKSWPLSSSPDSSPWNDPAIVSTSQFPEPTGLFPGESTPHWLKSLQQLTESDGPPSSHRLPFVQQFPLAGTGGWPPHTHNPPPGFRAAGLPSQQTADTHQMAEVLQ